MAEAYIAVADAQIYFQSKLMVAAWDRATFDQQQRALYEATRTIDSLKLIGSKADRDQVLRFPRMNQLAEDTDPGSETYGELIPTVPTDVKEACCDIALALLAGVDPEHEYNLLSRQVHGYAATRQQKDTSMVEPHIVAGVPSLEAWKKLVKYVRCYNGIALARDS
jgi:hypothetical protein